MVYLKKENIMKTTEIPAFLTALVLCLCRWRCRLGQLRRVMCVPVITICLYQITIIV